MVQINKIGDYIKIIGFDVEILLHEKDPILKTIDINSAIVTNLSDTGTHLLLKDLKIIKLFLFKWNIFTKKIKKYSLPIKNISIIAVNDRKEKPLNQAKC